MSFQTDDLALLALGILGDKPPDPDQPPLPSGVHFRWAFAEERGFPWHGFYLFRRESRPRRPKCLSQEIGSLRPGLSSGSSLNTRLGRLTGTQPLRFTDDFPATGAVEIDLGAGLRFELYSGIQAGRVDVRIGFRDAGPAVQRKCVDFRRFPLGPGSNPRTEQDVDFETESPPVSPPLSITLIESWNGSAPGLNTSRRLQVTLPREASRVDLLLTNRHGMVLEALTREGKRVAVRELRPGELQAGLVTLTGTGIAQVILQSPSWDAALLHEICFESPGTDAVESAVEIRALAGKETAAQTVVRGTAGQGVSATLEREGITAVEISPGPAVLIDLCYWPSEQGVTFGWSEVPGFTYPLCLPVAPENQADYPCPGKPADFKAAKDLALSRVTYPGPEGWEDGFADLHGQLEILVKGGPAGGPMAGRVNPELPGVPISPATQPELPKMPGLHPLDLVLLASLHPTVAQMLGLYFVDRSVDTGVGYDYLLLADPTGVLGGTAASALEWLAFSPDASQVDAYLVLDRKAEPRPPIAPPGEGRAYALSGPAARAIDGSLPEVAGHVGLWWPLPQDSVQEQLDRIVFYYPKRASLGPIEPTNPPADSAYQPLPDPSPVLVSEPDPQEPPVPPNPRSSDWPPPSIPLHKVDSNLAEGWYSYRLSGQDLFGRRSALGPPSRWFEWDPLPEHERHAFAVALLDKTPPPIPLGVEAWALDPLDRWLLADKPYEDWRKTVSKDLVGLRVRWRWTLLQQLQAPDTHEFRIYYQPGRWNALLGRIVKVTAAATGQSDVDLDFANFHPSAAFAGARLRVGNDDFAVLGSQPGPQLRLRVKNIGAHDEIPPTEGKPCTVAIPETHPLWVDTSLASSWARRLAVVPYDPPVRTVFDPSEDPNGQPLTTDNDAFKAVPLTVTGQGVLFGTGPDLSGLQPWIDHLWLRAGTAEEAHRIVRYDATARTVTLEAAPALTGPPDAWVLGRPTREYEIFLPAPDVGAGHPFEPSLAEPAVYAQIAVSAADDKKHVADDPKWNDPARFGNESRLSPSATVFRVLQTPPQAPELPDLDGRLYATPADYHDRSYSTFRFNDPGQPLRVHILRALDDSLFQRDWLIRDTRKALDPVPPPPDPPDPDAPKPKFEHLAFFPDGWDFPRRKAAAEAVDALAKGAAYDSLSEDAWAVLALLPGNERQPDRSSLEERDVYLRKIRKTLKAADTEFFPSYWTDATCDDAADALNNKITDLGSYLALSDNALRVLAALPGNEEVFVQITLQPLDMADPELQDRLRPDDDPDYLAKPERCAYTDTLPGRATNRYFYRARFVDGAQNQSALSLAGPPVYLRKVEPPRAPVITKVIGGDRQITIQWASNREGDVAEYRIYRADTLPAAADLRTMTLLHTEELTAGDPRLRPAQLKWIDQNTPGRSSFYYRIIAVDQSGNVSAPSAAILGRAYDVSPPEPPSWRVAEWVHVDAGGVIRDWGETPPVGEIWTDAIMLNWESVDSLEVLIERRRENRSSLWEIASSFLPATQSRFVDSTVKRDQVHAYRLRGRNAAGNVSDLSAISEVPARN